MASGIFGTGSAKTCHYQQLASPSEDHDFRLGPLKCLAREFRPFGFAIDSSADFGIGEGLTTFVPAVDELAVSSLTER
jgi:hypothetical protein